MTLILTLAVVPCLVGLVLLCLRLNVLRRVVVVVTLAFVACATIALAVAPTPLGLADLPGETRSGLKGGRLAIEVVMGLYVLWWVCGPGIG